MSTTIIGQLEHITIKVTGALGIDTFAEYEAAEAWAAEHLRETKP